jgi:hypothetical protein
MGELLGLRGFEAVPISLEGILLVVALLLLAFTLFVVVQSRREERARCKLIDKMYSPGTNVQRRLAAMDHLDAPWRPRDIEQRERAHPAPGQS